MQVDEDALLNLVAVLRLPVPIAKGCLPRLFLNLSLHTSTRAALLRILLSLLRMPLSSSESGPSDGPAPEAELAPRMEDDSAAAATLDDALQVYPHCTSKPRSAPITLYECLHPSAPCIPGSVILQPFVPRKMVFTAKETHAQV